MTDTKLLEPTPETSTVEINWDKQTALVPSDKHKCSFVVYKARDNTAFYSVRVEGLGKLPKELSGKYTTIPKGVAGVLEYLRTCKETFSVKSDILAEHRNASKA